MLRFVLLGGEGRQFWAERWCCRGRMDGWFALSGGPGELAPLVARYGPHLGRESFFELM
jgi:hypothetical protein